jgi:type IV pilus assembly protein PilO
MAAKPSALSRLSGPAKLGIGGALVAVLALGYWVIFYSDVSAKIETEHKHQSTLRSDLSAQQQAQASYLADRDELAMRQQRQRDLNKALPADTEPAAFLSALQQVANVSGVDLRAWQPQDEKPEAFYAKFPMKLEMSGRFHQIAKFAYEVGRVERIINMENIEIAEPKLEGDGIVVKAKCVATTFHALKPGQGGKRAVPGQAVPGQAPPPAGSAAQSTPPPGGK